MKPSKLDRVGSTSQVVTKMVSVLKKANTTLGSTLSGSGGLYADSDIPLFQPFIKNSEKMMRFLLACVRSAGTLRLGRNSH